MALLHWELSYVPRYCKEQKTAPCTNMGFLERGKGGQRKLVTRQPVKINDCLAAAGCRVGIFLTAVELIGPMSSAYKLMKYSLHNYAHLLQRMI